ncbi:MAG TPA: hypothetical protein VNK45_05120 [Candidatus Acidoferrales bacterium]|nr:hypothetical protein [Candidatus Acidoferrales bacterium]
MANSASIGGALGNTARHLPPRPSAQRVGIIGIHGPEATACIQVLLEAGMSLTAWTRRPDSAWAKRLARRGVAVHLLLATATPVEPEQEIRPLDWLLICPGQRLATPACDLAGVPGAYWPEMPKRALELAPAGLPTPRRHSEHAVIRLPTAVVLERWFGTPMRQTIRRGLLPLPQCTGKALRLISAHQIAQVALSLCRDGLGIEAATERLAGEWTPIPAVLAACRSQVERPIRLRHLSITAFGLRMGREWALMAPLVVEPLPMNCTVTDENCVMLDSMLDRIRRMPW